MFTKLESDELLIMKLYDITAFHIYDVAQALLHFSDTNSHLNTL